MDCKTFYLEGYGCTMNQADSEQIVGFLEARGWKPSSCPEKASLILLNTCAVKTQTEAKMLKRTRELNAIARKSNSRLVVCGCLPKINPNAIKSISSEIVLAGPSLKKVARSLGFGVIAEKSFCSVPPKPFNKFVSIIPIAQGCLGNCSYCCVKAARGELKSKPIVSIVAQFKRALKQSREIWLTSQDTSCYGKDTGETLPMLLKELLKSKKKFRVRVGMMNPHYLAEFCDEYLSLFYDERLYRFFHIPIQSGSNRILKAMRRPYKAQDAQKLFKKIRTAFPLASIATDVIVGFPGESEADFKKTVSLVKETKPDVLNISRFGARPNTVAAEMHGQLHGREKKKRSRLLSSLQKNISLERNRLFLGLKQEIFVSEAGKKNFVGRNNSYKAVVINRDLRGRFAKVFVEKAFPTYLAARILH